MEFLKNHYEKVILGVVLLALAGVAAWLPMKIQADKDEVEGQITIRESQPPKVEPTDLEIAKEIQQKAVTPPTANFAGKHNLFNPVLWIRTPDGNLEKIDSTDGFGPTRVEIESVVPLNFIVEYEKATGTGYNFQVTREDAERAVDRRRRVYYASQRSTRNDVFTLAEVRGPEEDPLAFELVLNDSGERIVVSRSKPYHVTNGYAADLSYPLEKKTWKDVRLKQPLIFAGDTNIVVDINPSEVLLRAVSNEKTTTIPYNAVP
ncbi:MAG TPA: hypothetical protein DCY13_11305 [Verrucomicrobiales bacterium]|nr:hypothetical protein [Verrucomicrobiales bacterium]